MNAKILMIALAAGTLLGPLAATAADEPETDLSHAKAVMQNSMITTQIKAKLAAEHVASLARVHVDTDTGGIVWLSGSVATQEASDRAVAIARETEHVTAVHSDIRITKAE